MFGREIIHPIQLITGVTATIESFDSYPEYAKSLIKNLEKAHSTARQNLKQAQQIQNRNYDLKVKETNFKIGDVVYRLNLASKIGESNKLKEVYSGPYIVTKVITPRVIKIRNRKRSFNIHHYNLKLCNDRNLPLWIERYRNKIFNNEAQNHDVSLTGIFDDPDNVPHSEIAEKDYETMDDDFDVCADNDPYVYVDSSLEKLYGENSNSKEEEDLEGMNNLQAASCDTYDTISRMTRAGRKIKKPSYLKDYD